MREEIKENIIKSWFNGRAVKSICQKAGINSKDCMAVGDAPADIDMFKEVGTSVAISEAEEVRKAADYVLSFFIGGLILAA